MIKSDKEMTEAVDSILAICRRLDNRFGKEKTMEEIGRKLRRINAHIYTYGKKEVDIYYIQTLIKEALAELEKK